MILFYIRHGDPTYVPDELTPLGRRQAESVAKRLAQFGIDEVYSSTSTRAMQTAEPTCEITKNELQTLDWMHESKAAKDMTLQSVSGRKEWVWSHEKYSQILSSKECRELGNLWYEHPALKEFDLGRTPKRVGAELDAWLAGFGYEHDRDRGMYKITSNEYADKRIALFAHEGVGKVFMSELLDIPFPYYAVPFDMHHTGVTAINFDVGDDIYSYGGYARPRVMTHSNDAHLFRDGLPMEHIYTRLKEKY